MSSTRTRTSFSAGALLIVGLCVACGGRTSLLGPAGGAGSDGVTIGDPEQLDAAGAAGAVGAAGGGGTIATLDAGVGSTVGCGHDPGQAIAVPVMGTIATMGTKAPDCDATKCGPWMYVREYFVTLPAGYDRSKAYPLIIEAPSAGGTGLNVSTLNSLGDDAMPAHNLFDNTVIHVGLSPPPADVGGRNQGSDNFDQYEGDDSVDFVFYENLYDKLAGQLCFDRNRVFAAGLRRGAPFMNALACKYAGDAIHPVRGVLSDEGGLLNPTFLPTCTDEPMAGMWVHRTGDMSLLFSQTVAAIARAMKVNGCTIGTGFRDAQFDVFPIGGGNPDTTCKRIRGCPDVAPLVVCAIESNSTGTNPTIANPGFSRFMKLFEAAPGLSP